MPHVHRLSVRRGRPVRGFTLVELLVVIAIIALLVSMLLPSLQQSRIVAQDLQCMSNLKGHGTAITNYAQDNNALYPPFGSMCDEGLVAIPATPNLGAALYTPASPYLNGWDSTHNLPYTPLYRGSYLDQGTAQKIQCPGYRNYVNLAYTPPIYTIPDQINPTWVSNRYSYMYLAGIPNEGSFNNQFVGVNNGGQVSSFWRMAGAGVVFRYNSMMGMDRAWVTRPATSAQGASAAWYANMPVSYALMADIAFWDNSTWNAPAGNHYWFNHSKIGRVFPNPFTTAGATQDYDYDPVSNSNGYKDLVNSCRSSNSVYADGHVVTRYPNAQYSQTGPNGTSINQAAIPDNGEARPMGWNYGFNTYPNWYFFRFYW